MIEYLAYTAPLEVFWLTLVLAILDRPQSGLVRVDLRSLQTQREHIP